MNAGSIWASTFGMIVVIYLIGVVVVCMPAVVKSLRAFVRGESFATLRDERLAAAECDGGRPGHAMKERRAPAHGPFNGTRERRLVGGYL